MWYGDALVLTVQPLQSFHTCYKHLCTILRALSTNHSFHFCQIFFLSQPCHFLPRLSLAKNPGSLSHLLLIILPLMNFRNSWLKRITTIFPPTKPLPSPPHP